MKPMKTLRNHSRARKQYSILKCLKPAPSQKEEEPKTRSHLNRLNQLSRSWSMSQCMEISRFDVDSNECNPTWLMTKLWSADSKYPWVTTLTSQKGSSPWWIYWRLWMIMRGKHMSNGNGSWAKRWPSTQHLSYCIKTMWFNRDICHLQNSVLTAKLKLSLDRILKKKKINWDPKILTRSENRSCLIKVAKVSSAKSYLRDCQNTMQSKNRLAEIRKWLKVGRLNSTL